MENGARRGKMGRGMVRQAKGKDLKNGRKVRVGKMGEGFRVGKKGKD